MEHETTVDTDYLWALEVVACHLLDDRQDRSPREVEEARRVIDNANLTRPRQRPPQTPEEAADRADHEALKRAEERRERHFDRHGHFGP